MYTGSYTYSSPSYTINGEDGYVYRKSGSDGPPGSYYYYMQEIGGGNQLLAQQEAFEGKSDTKTMLLGVIAALTIVGALYSALKY